MFVFKRWSAVTAYPETPLLKLRQEDHDAREELVKLERVLRKGTCFED